MEVATRPPETSAQRLQQDATADDFAREIEALLPGLRRYARYLTHDSAAADDLVQETVARGIEKIRLWRQGTDLRAWLSAMLHNLHVTGIRQASRHRAMVERISPQPLLTCLPRQIAQLDLRDLKRGLASLPAGQRSVVIMVGLDGERYDTIAARLGIPVGTVRSRLSRGRTRLRELMESGPPPRPRHGNARPRPMA